MLGEKASLGYAGQTLLQEANRRDLRGDRFTSKVSRPAWKPHMTLDRPTLGDESLI